MSDENDVSERALRTPKAAGIAGVVFSVLMVVSFGMLWTAIPADPLAQGEWLAANGRIVTVALNLIPFAGIAFVWFVGVIRDRLGAREDRFFATVFLGSGLLFIGMLFVAAAVLGAVLIAFGGEQAALAAPLIRFARALAYAIVNVYMVKMAGVFMISTSTVAFATKFAPRWLASLGVVLAVLLLFGSSFSRWSFAVFPLWVLSLSIHILVSGFGARSAR